MREIKFRVWDKATKSFAYGVIGGENAFFNITADGPHLNMLRYHNNKAPIDLLTGLKDKNGKEIYEGDILSGMYGEQLKEPLEKIFGKIEFFKGGFIINFPHLTKPLYDIDGNGNIMWRTQQHFTRQEWFYRIEEIEIVGNIHENPKLLKS